jgi:hypothetical protein
MTVGVDDAGFVILTAPIEGEDYVVKLGFDPHQAYDVAHSLIYMARKALEAEQTPGDDPDESHI